jgi:Rrf2 family nitric oxide-sensitive transcriptional repressor
MRLSAYSDYSLRVLMHTALRHPGRITVEEVAETFGLSRHHLVKVVHDLGRSGYLETHRGFGGGFILAVPADQIRVGDIVRLGEEADTVINCTDGEKHPCRLLPCCRLRVVLDEAAAAFFAVLDHYSLADLLKRPSRMRSTLGM